jgi:uncharacterized membrane protein (DUF2068 family)
MTAPHRPSVVDRTAFLRVLAVYKFVQTAILIGLGLATIRLVRPEVAASFEAWVQDLPVGYVQHVSERFLDWISGPRSNRVLFLGLGLFAYSALFLIEAVGLWLQYRWAEWLTVVATALLIPPEIYECVTHPSRTLFVLLFVNVTVVWLLAKRLKHELAGQVPPRHAPAPDGAAP